MRDYYSGFGKLKELIKNKIKLIENKNTPSTTIEHQLIEVFPNDKVINCDYFMFPNYLFKIVLQTHNIQSDFKVEESIIINISLLCDYYTIFLENQYSKYDRSHLLYILQENKFENTILIKKEIKHKIDAIITNVFPEKKFINHFILKSLKIEKEINILQKTILNYLLKLSKAPLNEESREVVDALFNTVNDIERIGDHAENIAELSEAAINYEVEFSTQGKGELNDMYNKVISTYTYALESMRTNDVDLACKVIKMEEQVDIMEKSCRLNHMRRLNENLCSIDSGVIYLDIITNLERISDHSVNIAQQVIAQQVGHN